MFTEYEKLAVMELT